MFPCCEVSKFDSLPLFFKRLYSKSAEVNNGLFTSAGLCFGKVAKGFRAEDESVVNISILSKEL